MLGKHDLDEMLAERDKLNADIQEILDRQTDAWGIKVANVEIKQVDIDPQMVRAIAKQAEAERLRRAKIINAEGEQQAAEKLVEAGAVAGRAAERDAAALSQFAGRFRRRARLDDHLSAADERDPPVEGALSSPCGVVRSSRRKSASNAGTAAQGGRRAAPETVPERAVGRRPRVLAGRAGGGRRVPRL